jgi:hypothetical protein
MTLTWIRFTYHYHNNVYTSSYSFKPAGKKPCASEAPATPDLVRVRQGFSDAAPMLWKEIGMTFRDMALPLIC